MRAILGRIEGAAFRGLCVLNSHIRLQKRLNQERDTHMRPTNRPSSLCYGIHIDTTW